MLNSLRFFAVLCFLLLFFYGCESKKEEPTGQQPDQPATTEKIDESPPPAPPIRETFDKNPQLSLFPRAGAYRPEDDDKETLPYWMTYIEHMIKTSGLAVGAGVDGTRCWAIKGIQGIDSLAFFSPLGVKPGATYRVTFAFSGEIPEKGSAGLGILEFDKFLWIPEQYPESLMKEHHTASQEGIRLTGTREWEEHTVDFTTSDKTNMIHLVFFRDGEQSRKPVFFDNIEIVELGGEPIVEQKPVEAAAGGDKQ